MAFTNLLLHARLLLLFNKLYCIVLILSDLEWLSKVFNDTKRRAVGLSATAELLVCYFCIFILVCMVLNSGASLGNRHGPGNGTIWLDDVQCEGTEASLDGCQHNGWGSHVHCQHSDDVSIACYGSNVLNWFYPAYKAARALVMVKRPSSVRPSVRQHFT